MLSLLTLLISLPLPFSQQEFLQTHSPTFSQYQTYKSQATISHLKSKRISYKLQLTQLLQQISDLQSKIGDTSSCESSKTCSECTFNSGCVWCTGESICVDGDSSGPGNISCEAYEYGQCDVVDCKSSLFCYVCLESEECGWCESSQECYEAESDEPGNCDLGDYFHGNSENFECPFNEDAEKEKEKYETEVQIARLEQQEQVLAEIIQEIDEEIQELSKTG